MKPVKSSDIPKIILLLDMSRATGRRLLRGIISYSRLHGPWKFHRTPPFYTEASDWTKAFVHLKQTDADGIVAQGTSEIVATGLPTICIDIRTQIPDQPNITADNSAAAKMAAAHLLERGLRHFAYCGFDDIDWSVKRSEIFTKYLANAGFEVIHYRQPTSHRQRLWENEREILTQWLKKLPKPIGIMACNDDRAMQIAETSRIADIKVPDEVAIIGVDNDELACELCDPPLTSIALDFESAGFEAAALLEKMMCDKKIYPETIVIKATHVVTRQSTDILAVDDPSLVDALRFIKNNSRKMIQVEEIAVAAAITRRVLEKRFRNKLGRSVHEEIMNVRMDLVARMLVETDMSVKNIAFAFGYSEANNLSRCFRKVKGLNPLDFRKQFKKS